MNTFDGIKIEFSCNIYSFSHFLNSSTCSKNFEANLFQIDFNVSSVEFATYSAADLYKQSILKPFSSKRSISWSDDGMSSSYTADGKHFSSTTAWIFFT